MTLMIGDKAPDFSLAGTSGVQTLSDFAGKPLVLVFYPGDDSPVCTKQLNSYNDDLESFVDLDAQMVGVSSQDVDSHDAFAAKHGLKFPLLADVDKKVAAEYGVLGPFGFPRRSVFVLDADGVVRYLHRAIAGLTFRPVSELVAQVEKLG